MRALQLIQVGESLGVIVPGDLLVKLGIGKGDTIYLIEGADGYRLTLADPAFKGDMELAEEVMREDRDLLRSLAKRAG